MPRSLTGLGAMTTGFEATATMGGTGDVALPLFADCAAAMAAASGDTPVMSGMDAATRDADSAAAVVASEAAINTSNCASREGWGGRLSRRLTKPPSAWPHLSRADAEIARRCVSSRHWNADNCRRRRYVGRSE